MLNNKTILSVLFLITFFAHSAGINAQNTEGSYDFSNTDNWIFTSKEEPEIINYKGKTSLRIKEENGTRIAYLKDFEFENGIIEVDIAAIPRFAGIVFRVQDEETFESLYFRPQNSRHERPVMRGRTVQYHSHPQFPWFYLRENYPDQYEDGVDLPPDEWFHLKAVVTGVVLKVYVNKSETPCLVVNNLKQGVSRGSVGLMIGNTSGGTFANFSVKALPPTTETEVKTGFTHEQEYLFDMFKTRRSVRKFKSTPVPEEHLNKILDIARSGPTSGNQQPWKFFVIQDRKKLDELRDACVNRSLERAKSRENYNPDNLNTIRERSYKRYTDFLTAPVYVVVLVDSTSQYPSYNIYDGSVAAGYLMIAARAFGYGTVFSQDSIPYELIKAVFDIPDQFERICFTPIGVPESWPSTPNKQPLEKFTVFEKFIPGENYDPPVVRTAIELDQSIINSYHGRYEINPDLIITITSENGSVFAQVTGQMKVEIFPESETEFFLKVMDAQITFVKSESGDVVELILHQGGQDTPAKKIN